MPDWYTPRPRHNSCLLAPKHKPRLSGYHALSRRLVRQNHQSQKSVFLGHAWISRSPQDLSQFVGEINMFCNAPHHIVCDVISEYPRLDRFQETQWMKYRCLMVLAGGMKVIRCSMQQVFYLPVVQAVSRAVLHLERLVSALLYALRQALFLQVPFVKVNTSVDSCDFVRDPIF